MNKIKKIIISFWVLISTTFTKIFGSISNAIAIPRGDALYGPPKPTEGEIYTIIAKPLTIIIAFIIWLFVVLSKKTTKKVKAIVVSILVILAILSYIAINYISTFINY